MGCNTSAGPAPEDGVIDVNDKARILADRRFCSNQTNSSNGCTFRRMPCEEELYRDDNFPASNASLGFDWGEDIVWLRPCQMTERPRLFVDGTSRSDVRQGLLGNCWFLSACAAVATRQDLIERVIDPRQKLFGDGYRGALLVSFWRFGEWVDVYVDDRLPTRDGCLIYGSCTDTNEFWLSIVEKAFAKLHGSYQALAGGHALEAFVDLTGGIAEKVNIRPDQFNQLQTIFHHGAFITCSRKSEAQERRSRGSTRCEVDSKGLIEGHAYTVTSVAIVCLIDGETVNLVRIRNPWGNSVEWEGDWNDKCVKWSMVSRSDKKRLRVTAHADGEFWMSFDDFENEFEDITVATLGPDFDRDGLTDIPRQMETFRGSWVRGVTAGGSRNNLEKFSSNPQILLHLGESDDWNNNDPCEGKCSILVGLMQEHRRSEMSLFPISFFIYKAENPMERLRPEYFLRTEEELSSGDFTNAREVIVRAHLSQGYYIIIPATFHPDCQTEFMIRVFALKPFTLSQVGPL